MTPEQTLWQTVVFQAAIDATAHIDDEPPMPEFDASDDEWKRYRHKLKHIARQKRPRNEADAWLRGNRKDFRTVCALAGLDPDFISNAYVAGKIDRDNLKRAVEK